MNENASIPIDEVGGQPPWPDDVDELTEGTSYTRTTVLNDASEKDVEATLKTARTDDDGATVVSYHYEDPTEGSEK